METILELKGLTKSFDGKKVVDDVSLSIKKGHIYGLIGPNGAGKTTIMKMIAGTCYPSGGSITLFGDSDNLDDGRMRSSFMIEAPYLDGSMTAKQNMTYMKLLRGIEDDAKLDEVLEFVGLAHTGDKKAKQFSLGMKQRLGIGMALLSDPELMILDEPVNGLDPEGIVEIRHKLLELCEKRGITILISSHILSELSELCTDFAIIDKGHLVECLSKEELEKNCRSYIAINTDDNAKLKEVLKDKLGITDIDEKENGEVLVADLIDDVLKLSKTITDSGLIITKFNPEGESLEKYYLSRVSPSGEGDDASPKKGLFGIKVKGGKQ